jgi:hypothetical protein
MKTDDPKFSELLRGNRPAPALPPRFQENVWRRIGDAEAPAKPSTWIDALAALILRPRLAFAAAAVLILAGVLFGAREGTQTAKHEAQDRYLASVIPGSFH